MKSLVEIELIYYSTRLRILVQSVDDLSKQEENNNNDNNDDDDNGNNNNNNNNKGERENSCIYTEKNSGDIISNKWATILEDAKYGHRLADCLPFPVGLS